MTGRAWALFAVVAVLAPSALRARGRALLAVRWPRSAGLAVVEVVVPFATRYAKRAAYYREIIIVAIVLWLRTDLQDTT
jgi:hypothetical protein